MVSEVSREQQAGFGVALSLRVPGGLSGRQDWEASSWGERRQLKGLGWWWRERGSQLTCIMRGPQLRLLCGGRPGAQEGPH
jgi:hypothetical protein